MVNLNDLADLAMILAAAFLLGGRRRD